MANINRNHRLLFCIGLVIACAIPLTTAGCRPCSSPPASSTDLAVGGVMMVRTELYFGLSKRDGGEITAKDFEVFVAEVVTPRFPDGLTIVDAIGQWRDAGGHAVHEKSKLLIIMHQPTARSAAAVEEIRQQYKSRFGQESVMRVTSGAAVSF